MLVGTIVGILIVALFATVAIWIVGKLGLGISVSGVGASFLAALVIAVLGGIVNLVVMRAGLPPAGGVIGAIVHLVVAAVFLLVAGRLVRGLEVKGFSGALIAALAIAAVTWIAGLIGTAFLHP